MLSDLTVYYGGKNQTEQAWLIPNPTDGQDQKLRASLPVSERLEAFLDVDALLEFSCRDTFGSLLDSFEPVPQSSFELLAFVQVLGRDIGRLAGVVL